MNWKEIAPTVFKMRQDSKWVNNWFSNLVLEEIFIDGIVWNSVENYYQAMKCKNSSDYPAFYNVSPATAKSIGRKVEIREDWETFRVEAMEKALRIKFALGTNMGARLMQTDMSILVEWNNWNDTFWGVDIRSFEGENMLGKLLMKIRDDNYKIILLKN